MQRATGRRVGGLGRAEVPGLNDAVTIPRALSDRVNQLIQGIRPGRASEQRRHGIADYVRRLIVKCFQPEHKVEAFMFGSVPLRTYLPDGDIDVSIFCEAGGLQDTWCDKLSSVLESEAENPEAEFKVANVSLINAEVKLLKCLVDNIVVDVSFNQIGGLCTLNFLEAMDRKIGGKHLFKKSIILIKAWCYYESRVLGAQHSLLSTYALETMVLHIFNVYHSDLQTPLEVQLFHWDDYCLTLSGPVSLKDLDINSVSVPNEQGKTLLIPPFMAVMLDSYSYTPVVPANSKGPGYPKYMNIMDPLLHSNNLGRSVSKTSEIRIKNAFGHGARLLNKLFSKDLPEAVEALDGFFKNTWLAQQRPRLSPQQPQPRPQIPSQSGGYAAHGVKPGNVILELLKDPHKDNSEAYERDTAPPVYGLPGFHGAQPNGNVSMQGGLGGVFPPPPPRGPEEKNAAQREGRQGHPTQHMRNLFEMQPVKNEGTPFSAFAHTQMESAHLMHAYPQLFNLYAASMKCHPHQTHFHRGRNQLGLGLQRARSAPNIGDLCPKKKEKSTMKHYPALFHVQHPKNLPSPSQSPIQEDKKAETSTQSSVPTEGSGTSKAAESGGKSSEGRKAGRMAKRIPRLDDQLVAKIKVMEARIKQEEEKSVKETKTEKQESASHEQTEPSIVSETSTPERAKTVPEPKKVEVTDQSVVIGEPPEQTVGEFHRVDRDFYQPPRSMPRRAVRPVEYHQSMHLPEMRGSLIQMANGQNPRPRVGMPERQMQAVMEMGPNGELLPSFQPLYPYFVNPQFPQTPVYNVLPAQGEPLGGNPLPRASGVQSAGIRHPGMPKIDARSPLVDLIPGAYQQFQWFRPDGATGGAERRLNGVGAAMAPGWNYSYAQANGTAPARAREDVAVRDSDDVLSGDIETLTQHLEVARNFIGCKSSEKDRSSRSSSSGHTPEKTSSTSNLRKGTPSPTLRQEPRPSSRERPRSQLEGQSPFNHHAHVAPAAPVGFPGTFPAQAPNVVYQVPPGFVGHPPPPPGVVERMGSEGDLLAQLHATNVNLTGVAPGYNFQGPMRGMHVPMMPMGAAGHPHANLPQMVDPNMQLPPQPPRSLSPRSKDPRGGKTMITSRPVTMEEQAQPIALRIDDNRMVEIDASVFQAVKAAMAGNGEERQACMDPNNRTSPGDPNSPRQETLHARMGMQDVPVPMPATRRQLEEGVVCYTGTKDFPPFASNRPPVGADFIAGPVPNQMAHLFSAANPAPAVDLPPQPQPRRAP